MIAYKENALTPMEVKLSHTYTGTQDHALLLSKAKRGRTQGHQNGPNSMNLDLNRHSRRQFNLP